jgi:LuxR family maltose regulon positive regulatory protein
MLKRIGRISLDLTADNLYPIAPPLLADKLAPPPQRAPLIARPQLIEQLNQIPPQHVALIAAPTGFGKTTLLSAWARQASRPAIWITLDEGDNDPARFGSYLLAALERRYPGMGAPMRAMIQSPQPVPVEWGLTTLINAIAAVGEPLSLVLDDCHTLEAPAIFAGLSFLIEHLPANLSLLLAGRTNPPLPLARLRARRQLTELRADALRFSEDEIGWLIAELGITLAAPDLGLLARRTEGWPAGVYLAARSIESQPDQARFVEALSGGNRFIVDYLIDEVLAQQTERVQDFLLQTSVLDRLSGPLCDAVTGQPDGQSTLDQLESANLLIPLDTDRRWYRYHKMFAEFFRARLERTQPGLIATLHRRAAAWYVERGQAHDAIAHALAAGAVDLATQLIVDAADELVECGEIATLRSWLSSLPAGVVERHARLCLWYAWAETAAFQLDAAERWLRAGARAADDLAGPEERQGAEIEIAAVRAMMTAIRGDIARAIGTATEILPALPAGRPVLRQMLGGLIAFGSLFTGEPAEPQPSDIATGADQPRSEIQRLHYYATLYRLRGQLQAAQAMYRRQLAVAGAQGDQLQFGQALAQAGLSAILCEQHELADAQQLVHASLAFSRAAGAALLLFDVLLVQSHLQEARGDIAGALATLRAIEEEVLHTALQSHGASILKAHQVRLWLAIGLPELAIAWANAYQQGGRDLALVGPAQDAQWAICDLALARVQLFQCRFELAARTLDRVQQVAEQQGRLPLTIEALVLQSLLWCAQADPGRAVEALALALALAEPEGYAQIFVREGQPIGGLLLRLRHSLEPEAPASAEQPSRGYVDRLLGLLGVAAPEPTEPEAGRPAAAVDALGESLSEREHEVLRLLAAGRSNQALAHELVVSIATVKTHLIHIYRKLGAHTRTEAIARARALGLV